MQSEKFPINRLTNAALVSILAISAQWQEAQ